MKLLFDQNLSFKLCKALADVFPDSEQVGRLGLERADDRTVWRYARANGFILVSLDADFAEMASLMGPRPKVVWLHCGNQPTAVIERLLRTRANAIMEFAQDEDAVYLEVY